MPEKDFKSFSKGKKDNLSETAAPNLYVLGTQLFTGDEKV